MKLLGISRSRWNMAFAMLFAVQLMMSAFCVITPAIAAESQVHCHGENMKMSSMTVQSQETSSMPDMSVSACVHCDVPTTFLKASGNLDHHQNTLLLAVISMPLTLSVTYDTQPLLMVKSHAPPRSSTLLFQTTSRILI
ncbi:MAG: hypothetical protein R8K22_07840 [Mariprofundaceae bacterium]